MDDRISGVVVTYHPAADVVENLRALRPQVERLIVIDNGSSPEALEMLRDASWGVGFELIENGDNLGIAAALNIGIRRATASGEQGWVLLFDQDSCVTAGFREAMLEGFRASRWGDRLGLLVPAYVHSQLGESLNPDWRPEGGLEVAMTSGSLLRLATFREQGLFVEEMFIDGVDHEYCLRLRLAGYVIDECPAARLLHAPGAPTVYRVAGKVFQTANYSPVRRYYQERNKIWIYRRYMGSFPRYCRKLMLVSLKDLTKIVLVEKGSTRKLAFFARGLWDGVWGRMGKA